MANKPASFFLMFYKLSRKLPIKTKNTQINFWKKILRENFSRRNFGLSQSKIIAMAKRKTIWILSRKVTRETGPELMAMVKVTEPRTANKATQKKWTKPFLCKDVRNFGLWKSIRDKAQSAVPKPIQTMMEKMEAEKETYLVRIFFTAKSRAARMGISILPSNSKPRFLPRR